VVYPVAGYLYAYPSALLFGMPLYLLLRHVIRLRWWHAIAGGFICSLPGWFASSYPFSGGYFERQGVFDFVLIATSGALSGLIFWFILEWPTRSNPMPNTDPRRNSRAPVSSTLGLIK